MLNSIKIINFRSIEKMDLYFEKNLTNITGENGAGKTNILQAISFLFGNNGLKTKNDEILKFNSEYLFIGGDFLDENGIQTSLSFSFDSKTNKKQYSLNGKKTTAKNLKLKSLKTCLFYPIDMNLFYLGPKYRRDFLDNILSNCYFEYPELIKNYENIVKNRNKVLKNIYLGDSKPEEIVFWNEKFYDLSQKIYEYRIDLINFFKERININKDFFKDLNINLEFEYITKTDLKNIIGSLKNYLDSNFQRDIILAKTAIGPHVDDFNIKINGIDILSYASRGETKSIIMTLKVIEMDYIKFKTGKTPILLIDDLSSELDEKHANLFLEKTNNYQCIFTSISSLNKENITKINI